MLSNVNALWDNIYCAHNYKLAVTCGRDMPTRQGITANGHG